MIEQKLRMQFSEGSWCLICRRIGKEGNLTETKYRWEVNKKTSQLPQALFYILLSFVRNSLKKAVNQSSGNMQQAIRLGLREAAQACGCVPKDGSKFADVYWVLGPTLLISFQVHEGSICAKRKRLMIYNSKAVFRWIVVVEEGGKFKFHPQQPRTRDIG